MIEVAAYESRVDSEKSRYRQCFLNKREDDPSKRAQMENRPTIYWYVTSVERRALPWGRTGKAGFLLVGSDDPDEKITRIIQAAASALSSQGISTSSYADSFVAEKVSFPSSLINVPPAWQADGFTVWSLDGPLTIPN